MASPTIFSTATSQQTSNSATMNITLPAGIAAGDLILAFAATDGAGGVATWPSPWVEIMDEVQGSTHRLHIGYLIASGGETTVAVTHTAERSAHIAARIKAAEWHGTSAPEIATAAKSTGSSTPNPPSVTASWGSTDNLFVAVTAVDDSTVPTVTGYPTTYPDTHVKHGEGIGSAAIIAIASRGLTAASDDPGTFSLSVSEQWIATTIVVRPAVAVTSLAFPRKDRIIIPVI